jgi:sugar phosphate isomerase/epimerase
MDKFPLEDTLNGIKNAGFDGAGLFRNTEYFDLKPENAEKVTQNLHKLLTERNLKLFSYSPLINLDSSPKETAVSHIPMMKALQKTGVHLSWLWVQIKKNCIQNIMK